MERATVAPARVFRERDRLLGPYVPTLIVEWLREQPEERHRAIDCTLVFVKFTGTNRLLASEGPEAVLAAVEHVVRALQSAAVDNEVALLMTGSCVPVPACLLSLEDVSNL
jgi:hypothetical protein